MDRIDWSIYKTIPVYEYQTKPYRRWKKANIKPYYIRFNDGDIYVVFSHVRFRNITGYKNPCDCMADNKVANNKRVLMGLVEVRHATEEEVYLYNVIDHFELRKR